MTGNAQIMGLNRIDNSENSPKMFQILNALLESSGEVDFASGYFNIGGFNLVAKQLTKTNRFRLLLGREPGYRGHVKTQTGNPVEIMNRQFREDLNNENLKEKTISIVDSLIDFLRRENVDVRLYTKGFFHAKAYIFPFVTIVGSSNFTAAGMTANSELNAVQHGGDSAKGYREWFEKFWEQSEAFKDQLIDILTRSKFGDYEYTPYEIMMKTLYTYFKDELELESRFAGKSVIELTDFQEEAFIKAKKIIEKYRGVIIADSVGLGKTYIGKKLLEHYAYHLREKALVICPAQLRESVWRKHLVEANIPVQIISQEELGQITFPVEKYKDIEIILIDESHNFRNFNSRYDNLNRILGGNKGVKLIMMTATPINNSLFDLYNQVSFITQGDDGYFFRAGIRDLKEYFKEAESGHDNLFNLLEELVIRRTRHYIKEHYKDATINGKKIHFPTRKLKTIHYNLEDTYNEIYSYIVECLSELNFAVYNIERYKKFRQDKVKSARGNALIGLMKSLVLKRFESSVNAFRITIRRQLDFHETFLQYLDNGIILDSNSYRKILKSMEIDDGDRIDELKDALPQISVEKHHTHRIRNDVLEDIGVLKKIEMSVSTIKPERDMKLQELKKTILDLKGKKVLIFSYFKDTAKYIFEEIMKDSQLQADLGNVNIKIVNSDTDPKYRLKYIESFAPRTNERPDIIDTAEEIDILISTDVLSEGQNLQDSNMLINYDLHWNPTRMVQRAGRIDRIGAEFDTLTIYNIFPDEGLETLLGLVKRLQEKISKINRNIGLDASILGEIVDPRSFNALEKILNEDDSVIDDLEKMAELASHEFMKQELAKFLVAKGKGYLDNLPDGIHSGLEKGKGKGLFYYFKMNTDHYWRYYNLNTNTIIVNKLEAFKYIFCDEDDQRAELDYQEIEIMEMVKKHILDEIARKEVSANLPTTVEKVQKDLSIILQQNIHLVPEYSNEIPNILETLEGPMNKTFLKELKHILKDYYGGGKFRELVTKLSDFHKRYFQKDDNNVENFKEGEEDVVTTIDDIELKLVCYELIA